jgi:hypothetical protein
MSGEVRLKWQYQSSDYFEESLYSKSDQVHVEVTFGCVEASLPSTTYDQGKRIRDEIFEPFDCHSHAEQLMHHRLYRLAGGCLRCRDSQGREDVPDFFGTASTVSVAGRSDVRVCTLVSET